MIFPHLPAQRSMAGATRQSDANPASMPARKSGSRKNLVLASAALVALVLSGCTSNSEDHQDTTMPSISAQNQIAVASGAPLETASAGQTLPVYWLGHSGDAVYLYREFRTSASSDDPIVAALHNMMTNKPLDSDYFGVWKAPSRLGASISGKNSITVDVSSDAFAQKVDQGIAQRSISQLVYTASAAAASSGLLDTSSTIQVTILVDGRSDYNAFNHVLLNKPLVRDPAFIAPIWITEPPVDATVKEDTLKVAGQVNTTGQKLMWSLTPVSSGYATAGMNSGAVQVVKDAASKTSTFDFDVSATPGNYVLSVYIQDPARPNVQLGLDTKPVTLGK